MTSRPSWRCRSNFRGSNLRLDRAQCRRFWSNNQQGRCRRCAKRSRRCGRLGRRKVGAQCQQGSGQHRSDRGEVLQDQHWGVAPIVREWSSIPNEGGGDQRRRRRRNTRLGRHRDRPGGGSRDQDHDCGRGDDLEHEVHSLPPWVYRVRPANRHLRCQGGYAWADSSDVTAVTLCLISARPTSRKNTEDLAIATELIAGSSTPEVRAIGAAQRRFSRYELGTISGGRAGTARPDCRRDPRAGSATRRARSQYRCGI
jgi:hypothetical protein